MFKFNPRKRYVIVISQIVATIHTNDIWSKERMTILLELLFEERETWNSVRKLKDYYFIYFLKFYLELFKLWETGICYLLQHWKLQNSSTKQNPKEDRGNKSEPSK